MYETHFISSVDSHLTTGIRELQKLNHAGDVSGGGGFTMLPQLRGDLNAKSEDSSLIFKKMSRNRPRVNYPHDIA